MKARYTHLDVTGPITIEIVVEGEVSSLDINILPGEEVPSDPLMLGAVEQPEQDSVGPPSADSPPATQRPRRGLAALIRGMYSGIFYLLGMAAAALFYVQDKVDQLGLPQWLAVVVGAVVAFFGYFLKKYYKPDGLL